MSERASALMIELNVVQMDYTSNIGHVTREDCDVAIKGLDGFTVRSQKTGCQLEDPLNDEYVLVEQNGNDAFTVKFGCYRSMQGAQSALFDKMVVNSLPINLLLKRYQIDSFGPSNMCIIDNLKPNIYFLRENVLVCVSSLGFNENSKDIAKKWIKC